MARTTRFDARSAGSRQPPPSGLCSLRSPGPSPRGFRPLRVRRLSWAFSSSGVSLIATRPAFDARQLPCASRPGDRTEARPARTRALRSLLPRWLVQSLSRPSAPPEISHLVTSLDDARASPTRAHVFTSGPEPRHRALASPLWVVAPPRRTGLAGSVCDDGKPPRNHRAPALYSFKFVERPRVGAEIGRAHV